MTDQPIHDAATVILLRKTPEGAQVLMGKRGAGAVFMPNKFVFPGGRVDPGDSWGVNGFPQSEIARLEAQAPTGIANRLIAAAIRELVEETGLHLAAPDRLRFIFRAITPPGRPRRFDARFFLAPVTAIAGNPDDFSDASDELSDLTWVALAKAREFALPFITEVVLAEVAAIAAAPDLPRPVPFFRHLDGSSEVIAL